MIREKKRAQEFLIADIDHSGLFMTHITLQSSQPLDIVIQVYSTVRVATRQIRRQDKGVRGRGVLGGSKCTCNSQHTLFHSLVSLYD